MVEDERCNYIYSECMYGMAFNIKTAGDLLSEKNRTDKYRDLPVI